jgi:hypothetical protein
MSMTTAQRGTAGLVGGALWALLPVVLTTAHLDDTSRGSMSFVAVAVAYWAVGVLPLALLLVGLSGLRATVGAGRLGTAGIAVSGLALVAMLLGNGAEMATVTFSGNESDLGHSVFLIGFLVLIVGSLLLGIALLRSRPAPIVRWAGALLVAMLPVGIGLAVLGGAVSPGTDLGFWAAITVPTGVAWVLLGRSMRTAAVAPAGLDPVRS